MDKKWRNLLIIIVIIAVLVALYLFVLPSLGSNPISVITGQADENKEYLVLANMFTLSDLNVLLFRENDLSYFSDSNNVELRYSKDKLLKFASDLNDLRDWAKTEVSVPKYTKFSSLIDIYQGEIYSNIAFADFSKKFTSVMKSNNALSSSDESIYCEFVGNNYPEFTNDFSIISDSMIDLSEKNYSFYEKYGVLVINYDFNSSWNELNYAWNDVFDDLNYCDQKGLIK